MTSAPGYGLVLCSQFTSDDDVVARFAEQVEQVRFARDAGFSSMSQRFDAEFDKLRKGRFILGGPAACGAQLRDLIKHLAPENILLRPQWPGMPQEKVMAGLKRLTDEVLQ